MQSSQPPALAPHTSEHSSHKGMPALTLAALGVVYGDIGTSPLYAFKEAFNGSHALALSENNVLATLSTFFWAVMLIISIKYVWVVLRFDNDGEGGVLSLTALAQRVTRPRPVLSQMVIMSGIFAAALFYGDAIITPAISVLSAIEGLSVATPQFEHWVIPITIGILLGLFMIQKQGTSRIGRYFGIVTVIWFLTLGTLGLHSIIQTPAILQALNPMLAVGFVVGHPGMAFVLMSAVFLALTGGEALYADMGHFGARPVRIAWYGLVWPALMLNYFGQGALVLRSAGAVTNPFYYLAPEWFMLALVGLAAAATVIASQATISGAYSMTLQASRLGYLPRIQVNHTSDTEKGQIYIPSVNWLMLAGVIYLVLEFESSAALAAAYGIAVSGTMIITSFLTLVIANTLNRKTRLTIFVILPLFMLIELVFLGSNLTKFFKGGWMPMFIGGMIFTLLITWKKGSKAMARARQKIDVNINAFLENRFPDVTRVPGTAIYLTSDLSLVPSALFHSLRHFKVMHEQTIFLHVVTEEIPYVAEVDRLVVEKLADTVFSVKVSFGFREDPNILQVMDKLPDVGITFNPMLTTYFVTRSSIVDGPGELPRWQCGLFSWMSSQSAGIASYLGLPPNNVVELGTKTLL